MARLTIEQKWWIDPRRTYLEEKAGPGAVIDGIMIKVWRIAQEYYGEGSLLPFRVFSKFPHYQAILDSDLAELRDGHEFDSKCSNSARGSSEHFVYVRGSKEYFTWILDIRDSRRIGGKKSAENRLKKYGTAQPSGSKNNKITELKPNRRRTQPNRLEVSDSDSGSVLDSGLGSDSGNSGETEKTVSGSAVLLPDEDVVKNPGQKAMARFCERYAETYPGSSPVPEPKDLKRLKGIAESVGHPRMMLLIDGYFKMPDAHAVKRSHSLFDFMNKLQEVQRFVDTGQFVANATALKADKSIEEAIEKARDRAKREEAFDKIRNSKKQIEGPDGSR